MAKILLSTYCLTTSTGFEQHDVYYNTGLKGAYPVSDEATQTTSCTPFTLPNDTVLESYCALDASGAGVMRTVKSVNDARYYYFDDVASAACNATCDIYVAYASATATTGPTVKDGKISVGGVSSKPPVDCYIAGLGAPNTITRNNPGILPAVYDFEYVNVKPGTYVAQLQDNGNCLKSSAPVTVAIGNVPGTGVGIPGQPSFYHWFKYEYVNPEPSTLFGGVKPGKIQGYAWDVTGKFPFWVPPFELNFPYFNEQALGYLTGQIVGWVRDNETIIRYYRALKDMPRSLFVNNYNKLPNPDENGLQQGWWERLHDGVHDNVQPLDIQPWSSAPTYNGNTLFYRIYEQYQVVRYGYAEFYEAAHEMKGSDYRTTGFPRPGNKVDTNDWTYLPNYSFFHFAAPESQLIDRWTVGNLVRSVRFHVFDPYLPNYVPTTSAYILNTDTDYVLFDETNLSVENGRGDLIIEDVIKTDVDEAGTATGSVAILASTPSPPITYHLTNPPTAGYPATNSTGIFEDLPKGVYEFEVSDAAGRLVKLTVEITDAYALRWYQQYDDLDGNEYRVNMFQRDWTDPAVQVIGTGDPAVLTWDNNEGPEGNLPAVVGSSLDLNLRTDEVSQFLDTALNDDRFNRVDFYRNGQLLFRGYINPSLYTEALLGVGQEVTLRATDGLGGLKSEKFINHRVERQTARSSMLSIILKCLSFTDVNLPLVCGLNLRDQLMTADADPLLEAFVHRNAYDKDSDVSGTKFENDTDLPDCRTVIDAILTLFHAQLFQADGCWYIVSASEVEKDYETRTWSPAGTLLATGTKMPAPLRILPPPRPSGSQATGPNELYWIDASQSRDVLAAAQITQATVKYQLEANLLENGYFVKWDSTNTLPLYWTKVGSPVVTRTAGEKVNEYALKFSKYTTVYDTNDYVLSPGVPHLDGQDEDFYKLKFQAFVERTTQSTDELVVTAYFQIVVDGLPYGDPLTVDVSTKDKWKEFDVEVPEGMLGRSVRLRLLNPVAKDALSVNSNLLLGYVALSIQPGNWDWENAQPDSVFTLNPRAVFTGLVPAAVELVHADLPLIPGDDGIGRAPKKMDVYAFRHAVSLENQSATLKWGRPGDLSLYPLLQKVADDRMELRTFPSRRIQGTVRGPGVKRLRPNLMLDLPGRDDEEGLYLVTAVSLDARHAQATITIRRIADGYYDGATVELPDGVRAAVVNGLSGVRIAVVDGIEGYRVASL